MKATHLSPFFLTRPALGALLGVSIAAFSGCAQIPHLGPAPTVKPIQQLASAKSFAAPSAMWPGDRWWETYGDPQLNALMSEALRDSPDLHRVQARLRLAQAMVLGARAPLSPEVSGNASMTEQKQSYNYLIPRAALPNSWHDYGLATLNLSWELDFWGKNRAALAAATSDRQAAQAEVAEADLALSTAVASSYAELLHLFTVQDSDAAALAIRNETVQLFRQRHAFGLENMASVRQVEAQRDAAQAELLAVNERIALQRNALAALVGAGPDRGLTISRPGVHAPDTWGLPKDLELNLLGRRPDIVAARLRVEAAAKRIDQSRAGFYPSVNLVAFTGLQSLGIGNLTESGSDLGSVGPAISLPIFNTERLQGQLRGARAEYDMAVDGYDATLTNALHEVADAVTSRKALTGELAASRAAVGAAQQAYDIVKMRYQGGLANYLDVLSAEDVLISARRALADIETRALVLDVALVRALGGGYQAPHTLHTSR